MSCTHVNIEVARLSESSIGLPHGKNLNMLHIEVLTLIMKGLILPLVRRFKHDERTNVYLYDDEVVLNTDTILCCQLMFVF